LHFDRSVQATHSDWRIDMSEELSKHSQSIIEIAKEIDAHVKSYTKNTPHDDKADLVSARLALDRLLKQSKDLDELLYKHTQNELR
jgi:hypothetical protein